MKASTMGFLCGFLFNILGLCIIVGGCLRIDENLGLVAFGAVCVYIAIGARKQAKKLKAEGE